MLYIYELNHEDSLIVHKEDDSTYIILEGIMILQKQFTNKEIVTTHILTSGNIINTHFKESYKQNYYYSIIALCKTYVSSLPKNHRNTFCEQVFYYKNGNKLNEYYDLAEILIHKNVKDRFIHLIMFLGELFGKHDRTNIIIDLYISQTIFASIVGSNTNTVSKIIKYLEGLGIISYSKHQIIISNLPLLISHSS